MGVMLPYFIRYKINGVQQTQSLFRLICLYGLELDSISVPGLMSKKENFILWKFLSLGLL